MNNVHIDYFSGAVADLKPYQKRDPMIVLEVLSRDPKVSTWDMGEHKLWQTINDLKSRGLITEVEVPYPWLHFDITESGKEALVRTNAKI